MLSQNLRSCANPHGSHGPSLQAPMFFHIGDGHVPTNSHLQPSPAPQEPSLLTNERLAPGPTLLTSQGPVFVRAEKEDDESDEKSASEDAEPHEDCVHFGIDLKPILPGALGASTLLGWLYTILFQIPMLSELTSLSQAAVAIPVSLLHIVVLTCMVYCAYADPGQIQKTKHIAGDVEEGLPGRAHKGWQYARPIRRYDHYCKWLKNAIGLHNHREFVVMVCGLVLIAVIGATLNLWLAFLIAMNGHLLNEFLMIPHLVYCIGVLAIDGPILRIHVGLISQNQLGQEWKRRDFYVANNTSIGDNVPVEELDDDEYNDLLDRDAFLYDPTKNPFDHGSFTNCLRFWCHPRWPSEATGEF